MTMNVYRLDFNQNGRRITFGVPDSDYADTTAVEISRSLLGKMTTDKGGVLDRYPVDAPHDYDSRTEIQRFDRDGGITVNGVHAV